MKIVKPDGTLAPVGEAGELYVRGPQVVLGYYRNEEAYVGVLSLPVRLRSAERVVCAYRTKEAFVDGWAPNTF